MNLHDIPIVYMAIGFVIICAVIVVGFVVDVVVWPAVLFYRRAKKSKEETENNGVY